MMKERSFDEMIACFNRRVSEMDIAQNYKMELLGMVTALGYKHEKTSQQWIPCKTRLPAPCTDVIVTDVDGDVEIASLEYDWNDKLVWWHIDYGQLEVHAWKPLPDPWKGEQNE